MVALPPPVAAAKEGFGPDGRKKLKNAGVPTNCPLRAATGQPNKTPSACGATTCTPQVLGPCVPGPNVALGATTVTGLVNPKPAASANSRLLASNCGLVEFMSTGRFKSTPRVY